VDTDPWGLPYRVVTKRLRGSPKAATGLEVEIARELFPSLPDTEWSVAQGPTVVDVGVDSLVSVDELRLAAARLPRGKAPGPDMVTNEVIAKLAGARPDTLMAVFNRCLSSGVFPERWKVARLVLLHKGKDKPRTEASSYRPLSLLDCVGKLFERLLLNKVNAHLAAVRGLSDRQFGFRRGKSTVDAVRAVMGLAERAACGPVASRSLCAMIALDVSNAFNSAPWPRIEAALRRLEFPRWLLCVFRSYMSNRALLVGNHDGGLTKLRVTCGVPQGSVLGPALWNIFYDDLLRQEVPEGVELVGFADDLAVVVSAHNADLLERAGNPALEMVARWMGENGLAVAPQKCEAVVLTGKWAYRNPVFTIGGHQIPVRKAIRYLGVRLDTRLTFGDHVRKTAASARASAAALGRLMPNVSGPSQAKRNLLMSVVHSKLLYAAPAWSQKGKKTEYNRNALRQAQRVAALRVIRGYRTVSAMAALVLARMPPAHLLAEERRKIYEARGWADPGGPTMRVKQKARADTLRLWQREWSASTKGAWTRRMVPDVSRWVCDSKLVTISYHMAQALTGHGCFQSYLYSKKIAVDPSCVHCGALEDTAEHTLFECHYWDMERARIEGLLGRRMVAGDVPDVILGPRTELLPADDGAKRRILEAAERQLRAFSDMVELIMDKKEEAERRRKKVQLVLVS